MTKWKISYWEWFNKFMNILILWLFIPFICYIVLTQDFHMLIISDTFFAVFITIFLIKIQYVIFNPPKYRKIKEP